MLHITLHSDTMTENLRLMYNGFRHLMISSMHHRIIITVRFCRSVGAILCDVVPWCTKSRTQSMNKPKNEHRHIMKMKCE